MPRPTDEQGGRPSRSNLPAPLTALIGRVDERAALRAAVEQHRLVTATGPGGVGKTRLAVSAAGDLVDRFADGVVFVDLAQVTDPLAVAAAIADAAGIVERAGLDRRASVLAALASSEVLLVLDNCEHLADAAREHVAALLAGCPQVRILATSRHRLLLPGEHVVPVPGLSLRGADGRDGDAIELFRVRALASGASADAIDDRDGVAELCSVLEGVALAIELGASRVPSMGLDGLRRSLADGFDHLSLAHGTDPRHRSLRATIDWSYRLLPPADQTMLRTCAVFAAPFSADAAAVVVGTDVSTVLDALGRLVDWNLVVLRSGAPSRYRILETVRQYAEELSASFGELDALRLRHRGWCTDELDRLLRDDATESRWCSAFDAVADDARAALAWAVAEGAGDEAVGVARRLAEAEFLRGRPGEAQQRYAQAAALATAPVDRHGLLVRAARAALLRYVGSEALRLLDEAAAMAEAAGLPDLAAVDLANSETPRPCCGSRPSCTNSTARTRPTARRASPRRWAGQARRVRVPAATLPHHPPIRSSTCTASRRASARCWRSWPAAGRTRRSPHSCS